MRAGFVYVMTNKPRGVLYIGVTADLRQRVWQHRSGTGSAFCRRYNLKRLVLVEEFESIAEAIAREKAMKHWLREWKIGHIEASNPQWEDMWKHVIMA